MAQDLFAPRADLVDDEFFIETPQTATATAALWTLLQLSRQEPRPWIPTVVLCGQPGSGRTTIARRFVKAAQRNVACGLLREYVDDVGGEGRGEVKRDTAAWVQATDYAEEMVRGHGQCPGICHPAAWVPEAMIRRALLDAQGAHPAFEVRMPPRPDRDGFELATPIWRSAGNVSHHSTRRTSMVLFDDADRVLNVPPSRRRTVLDRIMEWDQKFGHALTFVMIGGPEVTAAIAESRTTQVIRLEAMQNDAKFAAVCGMVFGTRDPAAVAALHESSGGLMGRLAHIARLRGLKPPYHVRADELVKLPALPEPDVPV